MKIKLSKSQWEEMGKEAGWIKKEAATTVPMGTFGLSIPQQQDARFMGVAETSNYNLEFNFKGTQFILSGPEELPSLIQILSDVFQPEIQQASKTPKK